MKLKIAVTAKDIKLGESGKAEECPIALAAKRAGLQDVEVGSDYISYLAVNGESFQPDLPKKAQAFINRVDDENNPKKGAKPFSFVLTFKKGEEPELAKKTKKTPVAA